MIVGGGMVGMTLSRLLRLRGAEPVVLERMPAGHYIPRGYMLGFQGYEPLEAIGDRSPYFYPFKRILFWASR